MEYKNLTPMLTTKNINETIEFYCDVLGFNCINHDENLGWASLQSGKVNIMLNEPNEHVPFNGADINMSLYIYTDEVDALWEQVKDKAKVCYPIESFDYGMREFGIFDNNGYLLKFGWDTAMLEDKS